MNINKTNRDKYLKYKYKYLQLKGGTFDESPMNKANFHHYLSTANDKYRDIIIKYKALYELYDKKIYKEDDEKMKTIIHNLESIIDILDNQGKNLEIDFKNYPALSGGTIDDEKIIQITESIIQDQEIIKQLVNKLLNESINNLPKDEIKDQMIYISARFFYELLNLQEKFKYHLKDKEINIFFDEEKIDIPNSLLYSLIRLCKLYKDDLTDNTILFRELLLKQITQMREANQLTSISNEDIDSELIALSKSDQNLGKLSLLAFCDLNNCIIQYENLDSFPPTKEETKPISIYDATPKKYELGGIVHYNSRFRAYELREAILVP